MQIKLFRIYIVKCFFSIVGQRKKFPMEKTEGCTHVYCGIDCCVHNSKLSNNENFIDLNITY